MNNGYDAVVVYDDLSQHAIAYRQMSLLLRRPPGREAFPGDIFYSHARLLERSAQLHTGGSLTALPIVQTLSGDIAGYIPTNIISITDGQIFLLISPINKGIRPAVDLSSSVSRVGSAAQYSAMAYVSKRVKSVYTLYRVYSSMTQLGGVDADAVVHIRRGEHLLASPTQNVYTTYSSYKQIIVLYALTLAALDNVRKDRIRLFIALLTCTQLD